MNGGAISGNRAYDLKQAMIEDARTPREAGLVRMLPSAVGFGDGRAAMASLVTLVASRNPGNEAVEAEAAQLRRETGMSLESPTPPQPPPTDPTAPHPAMTEPIKLFSWDGRKRHPGRGQGR